MDFIFPSQFKREPLAPPLTSLPSSFLPTLFLGVEHYFVESFEDVLRSDLTFSTQKRAIHPVLEEKLEQVFILNFLEGKDLVNLSTALGGGSTIVSPLNLEEESNINSMQPKSGRYRGLIVPDSWFGYAEEEDALSNTIVESAKKMYAEGCSVVVCGVEGIFQVPKELQRIFDMKTTWKFHSYTKDSVVMTPNGKSILMTAFPDHKSVYSKAIFVEAPEEEALFAKYNHPDDYGSDEEPPEPGTESPVVVHRGEEGGCVSYFGFVNDLDVSYGAIALRLLDLSSVE